MAWGAPRGLEDVAARLRADDPALTSLHIMRFRRLNDEVRPLGRDGVVHPKGRAGPPRCAVLRNTGAKTQGAAAATQGGYWSPPSQ
jgi:hypothetical protein